MSPKVKLQLMERERWNAKHNRDSNLSELRGSYASRRNSTDYYEDDKDFINDVVRRIKSIAHWSNEITTIDRKIFNFRLKYGTDV